MARALASAAVVAVAAAGWDSRNVSAAEWDCSTPVALAFGDVYATCGTEILFNASQSRPRFVLPAANASDLYTLIVVDRDATSAADPSRSPLRHFAAGNVSGAVLRQTPGGLSPDTVLPGAWFNYSGPRPPAGSGCHRYYAMVYRQNPGSQPFLAVNVSNPTDRLNWDFPGWAANNSLTKVAVNYWRTQSADTRTGPCDAPPKNGPDAAGTGHGWAGLGLQLEVVVASLVAALTAWALLARAAEEY